MSAADRVAYWQRRCRDAERRLEFEQEQNEHTRAWANKAFDEQRRLSDRCTYLYGVAIQHGASREDLQGYDAEVAKRVAACRPDDEFTELIHVPNGGSTRSAAVLLKHITGVSS